MLEVLVIGALIGATGAIGNAVRERRSARVHRQLQDIEFDRIMRSQQIHQTVAQARRDMVNEARRRSSAT